MTDDMSNDTNELFATIASFPSPKCSFFFSGEEKCSHFFSPDRGDCKSRKILKNDYLVAKIGVDTAENELPKIS